MSVLKQSVSIHTRIVMCIMTGKDEVICKVTFSTGNQPGVIWILYTRDTLVQLTYGRSWAALRTIKTVCLICWRCPSRGIKAYFEKRYRDDLTISVELGGWAAVCFFFFFVGQQKRPLWTLPLRLAWKMRLRLVLSSLYDVRHDAASSFSKETSSTQLGWQKTPTHIFLIRLLAQNIAAFKGLEQKFLSCKTVRWYFRVHILPFICLLLSHKKTNVQLGWSWMPDDTA